MAEVHLAFTRLAGEPGRGRLLVVGPSLGTSVEALWGLAAARLGGHLEVLGWDLPGHGRGAPTTCPFDISDLAAAVRRDIGRILGDSGRTASYAGVSLGGAVALELAVDPGPFTDLACIASAARLGDPEAWHERAALVREVGTPVLLASAAERWFAPGFVDRSPTSAHRLLLALSDADPESYALACEALARFDMRDRMGDVRSTAARRTGGARRRRDTGHGPEHGRRGGRRASARHDRLRSPPARGGPGRDGRRPA